MKRIVKTTNWLLAAILGLLGFAKCSDTYAPVEYGTPTADYIVKGRVETKANKAPVKGILVGFRFPYAVPMYGVLPPQNYPKPDIDYTNTDENGNYQLKINGFPQLYQGIDTLYVQDVDGAENLGEFSEQKIFIDYKNEAKQTKKGDGHWYDGEFTVTKDVELEPKNE